VTVGGTGVSVLVAVGVVQRHHQGVQVGRGVIVGVRVGVRNTVGVTIAEAGYSSSIAVSQSRPLVMANSLNRAPG
jgi:hypothetical protein